MKKIFMYLLAASLLVAALGFSGCTPAPAAPAAAAGEPAAPAPAPAPESDPTAMDFSGMELTVMSTSISPGPEGDAFRDFINGRLDGAAVNFEPSPLSYADTVSQMTILLASGDDSVDVFYIDEIMMLAFANAGFLEPIDDAVPSEYLQSFVPVYQEMFMRHEGRLYAIPASMGGIFFFVNQRMFDEAGVSIPTNEQEFIEAAIALTGDGVYGLLEAWDRASHLQDNLNRWSLMFGGNFYDWTLPGTQRAIQFMYDLTNVYGVVNIDNLADNFNSGNQKFIDGFAAMYFQWMGAAANFIDAGLFGTEIVTAPIPTFVTNHTPMDGWMWVVNRNSSNTPLAKEFMRAVAGEEGQALFQHATWGIPTANTNAWNYPNLVDGLFGVDLIREYFNAGSLIPRTLSERHSEYMDTVTGTLQRFLLQEISFEETIELGQQQIDRILSH